MSIYKANDSKNAGIYFALLITTLYSLSLFSQISTVSAEPYLNITLESINIQLYSGEVETTTFDIENMGASDVFWNLSYASNLDLDEKTVGLWYFNEGSGLEITDKTTNLNIGLVSGAHWTEGLFSTALRFDGVNDYVLVNNSESLNVESISIETWLKFDSLGNTMPIGAVKDRGYGLLYRQSGVITPHIWAQGLKWYDTPIVLSTDKWYYFALTYDSNTGELAWYLDGVKKDSRNEGVGSIDTTANNLIFGRGWTEKMFYLFEGVIDEIRISDVARSYAEILENYQRGIHGLNEWVSIPRTSGIINPGSIDIVDLTVNATILTPGNYTRELNLLSSDPSSSNQKISINLEVLPAYSDVAISSLEVSDTNTTGNQVVIESVVTNQGTYYQDVVVVSLKIDGKTNNTIITSLPPQSDTKVTFNWTPPVSGTYDIEVSVAPVMGESYLENNKRNIQIQVQGPQGPPKISIQSQPLIFEVEYGESLEKTFIIQNDGFENLTYLVTDDLSKYLFFDNLEKEGEWTHSGEHDTWEFGEPQEGPESSYSGKNCWGTNLDGNYKEYSDSFLISPVIDVSNRIHPELQFVHWYSIDTYGDLCVVELWDGNAWITLTPEGYTGYSGGWIQEAIPLFEYSLTEIRIRFRLLSDDQVIDKGWFIDDVYIIDREVERDWLLESPDRGQISPGESKEITVTTHTQELHPGLYYDSIVIHNNDPNNGTLFIPIELTVTGEDLIPPIANGGPNITIEEDLTVQFDGSKTTDNFGISKYEWTFTDGDIINVTGIKPNYRFETPGIYEILLTVVDTSGNWDTVTVNVNVIDITKPVAKAGKNTFGTVRESIELDASESTDNGEITFYEWDLGDGTKKNDEIINHSYEKPGNYNITLTVKDTGGNIDTDYIIAEISPPEGSGTYLLLIFIAFVLIFALIFQHFFLRGRTRKRPPTEIYRM